MCGRVNSSHSTFINNCIPLVDLFFFFFRLYGEGSRTYGGCSSWQAYRKLFLLLGLFKKSSNALDSMASFFYTQQFEAYPPKWPSRLRTNNSMVVGSLFKCGRVFNKIASLRWWQFFRVLVLEFIWILNLCYNPWHVILSCIKRMRSWSHLNHFVSGDEVDWSCRCSVSQFRLH